MLNCYKIKIFLMWMHRLKMIKKEREEEIMNKIIQKLPSYNNEVHIEYNPEDNSY